MRLLGLLFALSFCASAYAQAATESESHEEAGDDANPSSARARARAEYDAGAAHFDAGDYEPALERFRAAYEIERLPELIFNIASCLDRLERRREAVDHYEAYLEAGAANATYVRSRLRLLQAELARTEDDGTTPEPTAEVQDPEVIDEGRGVPLGGVVTLALGGAALATGGVLGMVASSRRSDLDERCVDSRCPPDAQADADGVRRMALSTDVVLAVGGAAALGGLLWVLLGRGSRGDAQTTSVAASCVTTGCSMGFWGAF